MKDFIPMLFPFFAVLFFGGFIALLIFGIWYNSPKQKGKRGEKSVNETLDLLPNEYFSLNNIIIILLYFINTYIFEFVTNKKIGGKKNDRNYYC